MRDQRLPLYGAFVVVLVALVVVAILVGRLAREQEAQNDTVAATTPTTAARTTPAPPRVSVIEYAAHDEVIANPERGLYVVQTSRALSEGYRPLQRESLEGFRADGQTLVKRYFMLTDYIDRDISDEYLSALRDDFEATRTAGMKLIVRFSYTNDPKAPIRDAPKEQILRHIDQLTPVLEENVDVIAVVQAGFIGVWGEWAFTDHFSDPYDDDYSDRQQVLEALLEAVPAERFVQIRTPRYKYGMSLNSDQAARTGFHNDCFLRGPTDGGTYRDGEIDSDKTYLAEEATRVPIGGETCHSPGDRFGDGLEELALFRWSYLNGGFHPEHIERWDDEGLLDEIARRLGYRLELVRGEYPNAVEPGAALPLDITLRNVGWAAPYNPRLLRLALRNTRDGTVHHISLDEDPRRWEPGAEYRIQETLDLPAALPPGEYELLLHLADPAPALRERPEYSIRLANEAVWEKATGYNQLLHALTVG